jgi:hypothetical protein
MYRANAILLVMIWLITELSAGCQVEDSLVFKGQVSAWMLYNKSTDFPLNLGSRYIPQINYDLQFRNDHKLDFEVSANINGNARFALFDSVKTMGQIKPYRFWARYSTRQFEIRLGLQKINFGSASLLRPLMWFDQVDPRDPLKLTDGVWGVLGRYYFLNNANIWIWGLYGNKDPKGWEIAGTNRHYPEVGGRLQLPVPKGEAAISYHYRIADTENAGVLMPHFTKVQENRIGFDIKLDLVVGFWVEGSWVTENQDLGIFTNQEIINTGIDYTFGIGNGLYAVCEQLLASSDQRAFDFQNTSSFSLLSLSYPLGLSDKIGGIVYYDWKKSNAYNFLSWNRQFKNLTLYIMAYWNPENSRIPTHDDGQNLFAGRGIQAMLVLNH